MLPEFQRMSASVKALNPHVFGAPSVSSPARLKDANPPGGASRMNKTEHEFSLILDAMKRRGEIKRYEYQGITLRWFDMRYTPDFVVVTGLKEMFKGLGGIKNLDLERFGECWHMMKLIEVKGTHIWDRDIVRFKGARAFWPEFEFEMHQKKDGQWNRIH